MKVNKPDFIASIILLGVVAILFYETSLLQASNVSNELGPKFFPYVCLILATISSVVVLINSIGKKEDASQNEKEESTIKEALIFYGLILLSILEVYLIGFLAGMVIGTIVLLLWTGWKPLKAIIFSTVSVVAVYLIFQQFLAVPLPKGILV